MFHELDKKREEKKSGDMRMNVSKEKTIDVVDNILNFLSDNPYSTLADIFKQFETSGLSYTKTGLNKILHKLEKDRIIKNNEVKGKHPKYFIIDTADFNIKRDAYAFKDQICHSNLNVRTNGKEREKIKEYRDLRKEGMVDMILRLGLISYYTYLSSYERGISPKTKGKDINELQKLWLRNAISLENNLNDGRPSTHIDSWIERIIRETKREDFLNAQSEIDDEGKMNYDIPVSIPEKVEEVKKLKKIFSKLFPHWSSFFQEDERIVELTKKRLREVCIDNPEYLLK